MESNQGSGETISLSAINEKNDEKKSQDIPPVSSDPAVVATGEKDATNTAGKSQEELEFVEKYHTHQENWVLPNYLVNPPENMDNIEKSDKKTAGTDAPDGFNDYRNKKTLTQGMMDVALFSANINQLRSVLDQMNYTHNYTAYAYILVFMLITSILLQVGVGLLLLLSTRFNINNIEERRMAYKYGNYVVAGIFLITVVNVFISAFGTPGDRRNPDDHRLFRANTTT